MTAWIYNLFMARATPACYALSEEEMNKLGAAVSQSEQDAGGVFILNCWATWASERWDWLGLQRFPSAESLLAHKQRISKLGWFNIWDTQVYLGSSEELVEPVPPEQPGTLPIYKLWLARLTQAAYAYSAEQQQAKMEQSQAYMKEVGGKVIAYCTCFSDERYQYFGIERYPNLEAVQEYNRCLREMDWFNLIEAEVLLGVRSA